MAANVGSIFAKVGLDVTDFSRGIGQVEGGTTRISKALSGLAKVAVGVFAFTTIAQGVNSVIQTNRKFEKSLSSLSSITGATGRDLDFYSKQAAEIGRTTTLSASQAVEAFKIMGSARPELLASASALTTVTKEAVVLAEAAGIQIPEAAKALAGVMNQFELSAGQAKETINSLAAGSKAGAVEIPELTDALLRFGTVAKTANISLQESIGLVELLGEKGIDSARSGTSLRNILTILQKGADDFNPSVVGLTKALENLAAQQLSTAELSKLFGQENLVAAQILVQNVSKIKSYTDAVIGTNVAYEQAAINTDNLDGSLKRFDSTVEALALSFNGEGGLTKAVRAFVDIGTSMVQLLVDLNSNPVDQLIDTSDIPTATKRVGDLRAALEHMKSEIAAGNKDTDDIFEFIIKDGRLAIAEAGEVAQRIREKLDGTRKSTDAYVFTLEQIREALDKQRTATHDLAFAQDEQTKAQEETNEETATGIPLLQGLKDKLEKLNIAKENAFSIDAIASFNAQIKETEKAIKAAENAFKFDTSPIEVIQSISPGFDDTALRDSFKNLSIPVLPDETFFPILEAQAYGDTLGEIFARQDLISSQISNLIGEGFSPYSKQVQGLTSAYGELGKQVDKVTSKQNEFALGMIHSVSVAAQSADGIGDALKKVARQLIITGIIALIAKTFLNPLGNLFGLGQGAQFADVFKQLSQFGGLIGGAIPKFAEGGVVPPGFSNDTYPAFLSSGEVVVPPGKLDSVVSQAGPMEVTVHITGQLVGSGSELKAIIDHTTRAEVRRY